MSTWEHYIRDQDDAAELAMLDDEARAIVAQALSEPLDTSWSRLTHSAYKYTSCGLSLYHTDEVAGRVVISSIIEGIDQTTDSYALDWPFTAQQVEATIDRVEKEAKAIWDATHGCEDCGPEDMFGYRQVNPLCPSCAGDGIIL